MTGAARIPDHLSKDNIVDIDYELLDKHTKLKELITTLNLRYGYNTCTIYKGKQGGKPHLFITNKDDGGLVAEAIEGTLEAAAAKCAAHVERKFK